MIEEKSNYVPISFNFDMFSNLPPLFSTEKEIDWISSTFSPDTSPPQPSTDASDLDLFARFSNLSISFQELEGPFVATLPETTTEEGGTDDEGPPPAFQSPEEELEHYINLQSQRSANSARSKLPETPRLLIETILSKFPYWTCDPRNALVISLALNRCGKEKVVAGDSIGELALSYANRGIEELETKGRNILDSKQSVEAAKDCGLRLLLESLRSNDPGSSNELLQQTWDQSNVNVSAVLAAVLLRRGTLDAKPAEATLSGLQRLLSRQSRFSAETMALALQLPSEFITAMDFSTQLNRILDAFDNDQTDPLLEALILNFSLPHLANTPELRSLLHERRNKLANSLLNSSSTSPELPLVLLLSGRPRAAHRTYADSLEKFRRKLRESATLEANSQAEIELDELVGWLNTVLIFAKLEDMEETQTFTANKWTRIEEADDGKERTEDDEKEGLPEVWDEQKIIRVGRIVCESQFFPCTISVM